LLPDVIITVSLGHLVSSHLCRSSRSSYSLMWYHDVLVMPQLWIIGILF